MKKMTEFTLDRCVQDVVGIIQELNRAVGYRNNPAPVTDDEQESIDFFLDPTNAVFFSTPISSAIKSQGVELLSEDEAPFNVVVNADLVTTYLGGGELALVVTMANKFKTFVVGAFDRSTGLGLLLNQNWVDPVGIKDDAVAAKDNSKVGWNVKLIVPPYLDIETPVGQRSKDRMLNLLQDCRKHLIHKLTGVDMNLQEE